MAKRELEGGYKKRVILDKIISREQYYNTYQALKTKYKFWVNMWPECTDPEKFVFEELNIATFLICLFANERKQTGNSKMQSFVDLGCGNGFLTYVLTNEGHPGKGIDLALRNIWNEYEKYGTKPELITQTLMPENLAFNDVDWIVGNHADELCPWIPIIASRTPGTKYFILPCCFYDFDGKKYTKHVDHKIGRYATYLNYVESIGIQLSYKVEREVLRIPSTKNIAIIGKCVQPLTLDIDMEEKRIQVLKENFSGIFKPRLSDSVKHKMKKNQKQTKEKSDVVTKNPDTTDQTDQTDQTDL